ncbi:MAG: phosphoglucosamine mutase [Candidatus Binatia bacterium]|nr:MAG: phosphoglucosamine mutase [Candidatus Binatia bacterium]
MRDRTEPLFGTDGIRGVANRYPMTPEVAVTLGRALVRQLESRAANTVTVVVGRDTRLSSPMLEAALAAGVASGGGTVRLAGCIPTAAVSFLTAELRASAGAVVSASHNPFHDNGIKLFDERGFKLSAQAERNLEELLANPVPEEDWPHGALVGRIESLADAAERYAGFARSRLAGASPLAGLRLVVDCAHGAASGIAPRVFSDLGARVHVVGAEPDGTNINEGCGTQHIGTLRAEVLRVGADGGVAFDGDADRVLLVDEEGEVVDGDHVLFVLAEALSGRGRLARNVVVGTSMSNLGLELGLRSLGIEFVRVPVGDRNVVEELRRRGGVLGGEPSGHVVQLHVLPTGDGLLTALAMLERAVETGRRWSEWRRRIVKYPQVLRSVPVRRRLPLDEVAELRGAIRAAEASLGNPSRVVVRYSGTEPVLRIMVEGDSAETVRAVADELASVAERCLA